MPELAISTTFVGYDDIIPYLPLFKEYGIRNIELRGYPPRIDYHDQAYLEKLKTGLKEHEMNVSSYHLPFHDRYLSSLDEKNRETAVATMLDSVKAALFLDVQCLILHPGGLFRNRKEREAGRSKSRASIKEVLRSSSESGIPLAMENMLPLRIGQDIDWLIGLRDEIDHEMLGICFDTSHANLLKKDLASLILKLGRRIINVHFSDNHGKKDEHLFPFYGTIKWEKVLSALKCSGFNRPWTLEIHQCDSIERMLAEALACHGKLMEIWEKA